DAEKAADDAVTGNAKQLLARWVLARLYRDRGQLDKADKALTWFIRYYNDNDVKDPEELFAVGLGVEEHARWNKDPDERQTVLSDLYEAALKKDKELWQAEYVIGLMMMQTYNRPEALRSFDKALKINASAAEPLVGKGIVAYQEFRFEDAERFAEQAL